MNTDNKFGKKLRELRLKAGFSVRDLAERANVHYSYISKLENGLVTPPSAQKVADLADALGFDKNEMLGLAEQLPRGIKKKFRLYKSGDFGTTLKKLRLKRHLSQAELAARTSVNPTYISKMENHAIPPPSDDVIKKLAEALRTKPHSLLKQAGKFHSYQQIFEQRYDASEARRNGMLKLLKSPLTLGRLTLALVLVVAFSVALWTASPQPAQAITIGVSNNSATATIGKAYTFTVTITVQNTDKLPIQAVDIRIESTTHPSSYTTTLNGLPIPSTPSTSDTASINGATVNVLTGSTWGTASTSRYGYGYGYATGATTNITGTGYGYGYGYSPYVGTATITYSVSWTPPSWSTSDTYRIVVLAYLTSGNTNSAFTQVSASTFTLAASPVPAPVPSGGGAATGGGAAPAPVGSTVLTGSISTTGVTTREITATAPENSQVKAVIPNDTTALGPNGQPLQYITVNSVENPPATGNSQVVGIPYNFGPSGAKFDKPVTLTFPVPTGYTAEQLSRLTVAFYDVTSNTWVSLTNVHINPDGTISGDTTHFTIFAVILQPVPTTVVTPTATAIVTPTVTPTPSPSPVPTVTPTPTAMPSPVVTNVPLPGPTVTSTVMLPGTAGTGVQPTKTNWLWPIVIGIIGAAVMFFVVRWGWNMRRD